MIQELFDLKPCVYANYNELEMLPYLLEHEKLKVVIYGAGSYGRTLLDYLKNVYSVKPIFMIDRNSDVKEINGIPIISPQEFGCKTGGGYLALIGVCVYDSDKDVRAEIDKVLNSSIVKVKLNGRYLVEPFLPEWREQIKANVGKFEDTYYMLNDEISKETYVEYLKCFILGKRFSGTVFPEQYKYWGIDDENSRLFELMDSEVVLNCGACFGDTVYNYIKCHNRYKKMIAVEGDKDTYIRLKNNLSFLNEDDKDKIYTTNIMLGQSDSEIDTLYMDEKISLITMDIEGAELQVLKSGKNVIENDRPVLAVCVYHKWEDLITIPQYISSIADDYVYVLRKYPTGYFYAWYSHTVMQLWNELVLYAIPKERYIGQNA